MHRDAAEVFAMKALGWIAEDPDIMGQFLGASGSSVDDIKRRATEPEFLIAVLDFLMMQDEWVIACCDRQSVPYTTPMEARGAIPGGEAVHWT
jgi:hypothetical protein